MFVAASLKFKQVFFHNQQFFSIIWWQATSLVGEDVSRGAEDSLAGHAGWRRQQITLGENWQDVLLRHPCAQPRNDSKFDLYDFVPLQTTPYSLLSEY